MNELLMIVGVIVFFISVYGVVMIGGHLLAEVQDDTPPGSSEPQQRDNRDVSDR